MLAAVATIAAIGVLVCCWRERFHRDIKYILITLIAVTLFRHVSNTLEWTAITSALDPYEDYVEIMEAMLWAGVFYAFVHDLARRKLQHSERLYRTLIENIDLGITLVNSDYEIVMTNAKHGVFFDKSPADLIGKHCFVEFEKRESVCPDCPGRKAMATGCRAEGETEGVRDDGSRFPVRIQAFPLMGADGKATGFIEVVEDITERKQAERAIRESEDRFRTLVENIPGVVYRCAIEYPWPMQHISEGVLSLTGYSAADIMADKVTIGGLIHPDDLDNVINVTSEGILNHQPFTIEYRMLCINGKIRWVHERGRAIYDADGQPLWLDGVIIEVTARRRAEDALRASEARYRVFFDNSHDAFMTLGPPSWKFTSANPAMVEMFRARDEEEMTSIGPLQVSPEYQPDGRPSDEKAKEMIETAMRDGSHFFEWEHRRLDGEEFPATVLLSRLELGGQVMLQATVRDITARKKANQALRESQRKLAAIFSQALTFSGLLDTAGNIIAANAASLTFIGCSEQDVLGKPFGQTPWWAHSSEMQQRVGDAIDRALKGESVRFEATLRSFDGEHRIFDCTINPFRDETGTIRYLIPEGRDITERKQAEEQRLVLERQFLHTQKLESLGILAGGVAHDFNNLLLAIIGNTDLALLDLAEDSPVRENIEDIKKISQRAADLARQMLAYSGKGKFVVERLDLSEVVREMTRMLDVSITKKATVKSDLADDLPEIQADPTQLRQVIMNLITNASEAIADQGGEISIATSTLCVQGGGSQDVYIDGDIPEGAYVMLEVADTGCGMDGQTQAKMFDPFFTTKLTGRGLGMAGVLGIIRGHKGLIRIMSEPGQGTTVRVLLPVAQRDTGSSG